jgi:hypothetical protein
LRDTAPDASADGADAASLAAHDPERAPAADVRRDAAADGPAAASHADVPPATLAGAAEVGPSPPDAAATEVGAASPAPALAAAPAGAAAGQALARLAQVGFAHADAGAAAEPDRVQLTLRSDPPGAELAIAGRGAEVAPRVVSAAKGTTLWVTARLEGHKTRRLAVAADHSRAATIKLAPEALGAVRFRFFPASARVAIDGTLISTGGSNLVERKLSEGEHRLTLTGPDGAKRAVTFRIKPQAVTNLQTLRLSGGPKGSEPAPR